MCLYQKTAGDRNDFWFLTPAKASIKFEILYLNYAICSKLGTCCYATPWRRTIRLLREREKIYFFPDMMKCNLTIAAPMQLYWR